MENNQVKMFKRACSRDLGDTLLEVEAREGGVLELSEDAGAQGDALWPLPRPRDGARGRMLRLSVQGPSVLHQGALTRDK